jgi:branched-chain amino acid transport system ATP-binding protein
MLKIRNLSKSFGGVRAVDNVSFDVPLGSIVALIGPNGAGKTSTFNLISGLAEPDTGTVTLFDKQLTGKSPDDVCRAGIARTFQISQLFETLSVRENIQTAALFGRRPRDDLQAAVVRANELVRAFDLVRHAEALPKDLTFAQRRNVEIARALVMDPQILLLDEVLAGLTASEIEDVIATIERVKSPTVGILLVEHQMRAVMRLADSVVVMMQGSVLMQGSPDEVRRHPKVLSAYLGEEIDASGSLVLQRSEDALPATRASAKPSAQQSRPSWRFAGCRQATVR